MNVLSTVLSVVQVLTLVCGVLALFLSTKTWQQIPILKQYDQTRTGLVITMTGAPQGAVIGKLDGSDAMAWAVIACGLVFPIFGAFMERISEGQRGALKAGVLIGAIYLPVGTLLVLL